MYFTVKYSWTFGFIKPWTAVRDGETFSQQFLTPSIIKGIELKLFPELLQDETGKILKIKRHRLSYDSVSPQTERTQAKAFTIRRGKAQRQQSILTRGTLINPVLWLAFSDVSEARIAASQHICLCRNEDLLLPDAEIKNLDGNEFDSIDGFELDFENSIDGFVVGFNRYKNSEPMYGTVNIFGSPMRITE